MPEVSAYHPIPGLETSERPDFYPTMHPIGSRGDVTIAHGGPRWKQLPPIPVSQLPTALSVFSGDTDVYVTCGRFEGARAVNRLRQISTLFCDLDFQNVPALRDLDPMTVVEMAVEALDAAGAPPPSTSVSSGRGVYLFWFFGTPVPRRALPRFNAAQRAIWEILAPLGADRAAVDAARVLRVVGSRNSKARDRTRVEMIAPVGTVYDFDRLVEALLPMTRDEHRAHVADLRIQRALRRPQKGRERAVWTPQGYGVETLQEARLRDLQHLRNVVRFMGDLPPRERDVWMLLAGVAMSYLAPPKRMRAELFDLARQAATWSEGETRSRMHAVIKRASAAWRGETVEWNGQMRDPRYWYRSRTIVERLNITVEEQAEMVTLIDDDTRRERNREKHRKRRRAAGAEDRFAIAAQNAREALRLRSAGRSTREIADALRISQRRVQQLLKQGGEMNATVYGVAGAALGGCGVAGVGDATVLLAYNERPSQGAAEQGGEPSDNTAPLFSDGVGEG